MLTSVTLQDSDDRTCDCGIPARQLTVTKDGPNKGRIFYKCSNSEPDNCRYFEWGDEEPRKKGGGGLGSVNVSNRSTSTGGGGGGGGERSGKCYKVCTVVKRLREGR